MNRRRAHSHIRGNLMRLAGCLLVASLVGCASTSRRPSYSTKSKIFTVCANVAQVVARAACR